MCASIIAVVRQTLIACCLLPSLLFAAQPAVTVDPNSLGANKADINFISTINGDNHMDIVINPGGSGCSAGQFWDVNVGGCTSPVTLRTESTSRACSCTCPQKGSCTSSQSGTYPVYGWRLPPSGSEQISSYGATSWGACQMVTNACESDTTAPPGGGNPPPPGTTLYVTAFICNSSNPSYGSGVLSSSGKDTIIGVYRGFNYGSRCPESGGYTFWQSTWDSLAKNYQQSNGGSYESALDTVQSELESQMRASAKTNQENDPAVNGPRLNAACTQVAQARYGGSVTATYLLNTGDTCVIN